MICELQMVLCREGMYLLEDKYGRLRETVGPDHILTHDSVASYLTKQHSEKFGRTTSLLGFAGVNAGLSICQGRKE